MAPEPESSISSLPSSEGQDRFSIRVGDHYRAIAKLSSDSMRWVWIGTHAEYDQLVDSE
jgi:hypothetical protein